MSQHTNQPLLISNEDLQSETVQMLLEKPNSFGQLIENTKSVGLFSVASHFSGTGLVLNPNISEAMLILHKGLLLGEHMYNRFAESSGLEIDKTKQHHSDDMKLQYSQKRSSATFVSIFATAYYCQYHLDSIASDSIEVTVELPNNLHSQDYTTFNSSRKCMLYNLEYCLLEQSKKSSDIASFLSIFIHFFNVLMEEFLSKYKSFKFLEFYTDYSYILEDSKFTLQGFEIFLPGQMESVDFNPVYWGDIVGNPESKQASKRLIDALMCFKPDSQQNVMSLMGAYTKVNMAYGPPGTGKSMEIAAIATELKERSADLGILFKFVPFPDNMVSTYQGGSAERAQQYMQSINDPKALVFAPIDDAENNLQDREADGVSAGVKEVIGVFLRYTEGAYATNYGNLLINLYTNIPGIIDKAVLSRIQKRYFMGGATTVQDMMDQNYLGLIKPFNDMLPGFVDLQNPTNYEYMRAQQQVNLEAAYENRANTDIAKVQDILERATKQYKVNHPEFFGHFYAETQKVFPTFTSREVRNIQSAVKTRMFDFDFPQEWREQPEIFYLQDIKLQEGMITEIMREHLQGKGLADILLQESVSHISNLASIADAEYEKQVEKEVTRQLVFRDAQNRLPKP